MELFEIADQVVLVIVSQWRSKRFEYGIKDVHVLFGNRSQHIAKTIDLIHTPKSFTESRRRRRRDSIQKKIQIQGQQQEIQEIQEIPIFFLFVGV